MLRGMCRSATSVGGPRPMSQLGVGSWSAIRPVEPAAAVPTPPTTSSGRMCVRFVASLSAAACMHPRPWPQRHAASWFHQHAAANAAAAAAAAGASSASACPAGAAASSSPSSSPSPSPLHLSARPRVLLLTKTPRYEHEKNSTGLAGPDLHAELSKLGFVSDRLVGSYERHMGGVAQLQAAMKRNGMEVVCKHVDAATHVDLQGVELIVAAGGDGTMLKAAALLGFQHQTAPPEDDLKRILTTHSTAAATDTDTDSDALQVQQQQQQQAQQQLARHYLPIPLLGVNTDPQHSSGILCAFSLCGPESAAGVVGHLLHSPFVRVSRSRIEITLVDKTGVARGVGQFATNDVVVAERDPGRPIVYELTVGQDGVAEIQRSSGVLVCTGTGSTAWMANAAGIHPDQVAAVLRTADCDRAHSPAAAYDIADRLNSGLRFDCSSPLVEYYVREPLRPLVAAGSSGSEGRGGYQQRHGWSDRIAVRSLGWDAVISIDGIKLIQLPKGTTAVLLIGKQPGATLNVIQLANAADSQSQPTPP